MRCADESRKAQLCLVFSVSLVCAGLLTLSLVLYYVVRYQAHGAWHFHPARCIVQNISSSTLQRCDPDTHVCLQSSASGACSEWSSDVQCVTINVIHQPVELSTGSTTNSSTTGGTTTEPSGSSTATYYTNIASMWNNPECSLVSPSCGDLLADAEEFHRSMEQWIHLLENREWFKCYGGEDRNRDEVLGTMLYTSTISFLAILLPVLMVCVGLGVGAWSCLELVCCNPTVRAERYQEKMREKRQTERKAAPSATLSATRGKIASCNTRLFSYFPVDTDKGPEQSAPMMKDSEDAAPVVESDV